jgi:hypothetical protein
MTWSSLAEDYADAITAAEVTIGTTTVKAYHDPQKAAANRPCVLVGLPTVSYTHVLAMPGQAVLTWQMIALASRDSGALSSLHELEALVAAVTEVFDIDNARPATYQIGEKRVPAYVITVNDA